MDAVETLVTPQYNPPDRITTDNKGVTCELWEIPDHSRYYLVRRNQQWDVYDRLKKRPVTRYIHQVTWDTQSDTNTASYYAYRIFSDAGNVHQKLEHRLVLQCLSPQPPEKFVHRRNGDTLDNSFENLYYSSRRSQHQIRDKITGEIYSGTLTEIRKAARIGSEKVSNILKGMPVKGFQLIYKDG